MIAPVTAAIIFNAKKEILIARRKLHKSNGGLWELPGGKLEKNESPEECLKREILEELKIVIRVDKIFHAVTHYYDHITILLIAYLCTLQEIREGELTDHDQYLWVKRAELQNFDFSPADIPVIQKLQKYELCNGEESKNYI